MFYYLIHIQYFGFRFHGWAKQPNLKTVHFMVDKTLSFVFGHEDFKTMTCSRTDSMVSANHSIFELFLKAPIEDFEAFLTSLNSNFPPDIRALKIEETDKQFNIINSPKTKEYLYLFCCNQKPHPFSAGLMMSFEEDLDIDLMQQGAQLFEGEHDFIKYCTKPSPNVQSVRTIEESWIVENDVYQANFFPERSYIFRVKGKGFMRNQIRLMMGELVRLGKGETDLAAIEYSLTGEDKSQLNFIAPASGLILNEVRFD